MNLDHLTQYWPVLLSFGAVLICIALFHQREQERIRRGERGKFKFVLASAGCMGCLAAASYIIGIVAAVVSIVTAIYRVGNS